MSERVSESVSERESERELPASWIDASAGMSQGRKLVADNTTSFEGQEEGLGEVDGGQAYCGCHL